MVWKKHFSKRFSKEFWFNNETGKSSWHIPSDLNKNMNGSEDDWIEVISSKNKKYWYNKVTNESKWIKPEFNNVSKKKIESDSESMKPVFDEESCFSLDSCELIDSPKSDKIDFNKIFSNDFTFSKDKDECTIVCENFIILLNKKYEKTKSLNKKKSIKSLIESVKNFILIENEDESIPQDKNIKYKNISDKKPETILDRKQTSMNKLIARTKLKKKQKSLNNNSSKSINEDKSDNIDNIINKIEDLKINENKAKIEDKNKSHIKKEPTIISSKTNYGHGYKKSDYSMPVENGNGMAWSIEGNSHWTRDDYREALVDLNESIRDMYR